MISVGAFVMMLLIAGLVLFFAVHLMPANTALRNGLVERFGVGGYKIGFSILSLVGFVLIVIGYAKMQTMVGSKNPILWYPPVWTKHVAVALMLPAMIFLVAAYVPSRIKTALKHPMLVAIKIWALAHLIANGTVAAAVLFGGFLAYAIVDRISLKSRTVVADGSASPPSIVNDVVVVVVGTALFAALLLGGHEWLIGKAPLG